MTNSYQYWISQIITDWTSSTYKVALVKSSSAPVYNTADQFVSDFFARSQNVELVVSGYARQTLGSKAITLDNPNSRAILQAQKAVFTALATGDTIQAAIVFKFVSTDANSPIAGFFSLTSTPTNGGDIEIRWNGIDGVGDVFRFNA
jgi:hypothetical protein